MHKADFDYEADDFQIQISRWVREYKRSSKHFREVIEHWQGFAPDHFNKELEFSIAPEQCLVDGSIIGQKFSIRTSMSVKSAGACLLARVTVKDILLDAEVELAAFLVSPEGAIFSQEGEQLVDRHDDLLGYKLLIAITRRVLGITSRGE